MKDMNTPEMIKKLDYSEYEGRYDESVNDELTTSPENLSIETMREYLYGYTFTDDYVNGVFPDEMSMDYWRDSDKGIYDFEADFPCYDRNKMPNGVWDTKGDNAFEVIMRSWMIAWTRLIPSLMITIVLIPYRSARFWKLLTVQVMA